MIKKLEPRVFLDENNQPYATGLPTHEAVVEKVNELIEHLNTEPTRAPSLAEYRRAYEDWYLKSASEPVTYAQYLHIMGRIPHEIFNILKLLDAQEAHDEKTT